MNIRSIFFALTAILALLPSSLYAAAPGEDVAVYLTLTMKTQCDANIQGYRSKAEAGYAMWRHKHAEIIAAVEAARPPAEAVVTDSQYLTQLRSNCAALLEQFLGAEHAPDKRLSTPDKTWTLFLTALRSADKETLAHCFDPYASQFSDILLNMSPEQLVGFANSFKEFHLTPPTADSFQEAAVVRPDGKSSTVLFVKSREGWRISQL